ncbi:MAG: hypothetical protein ACOX5R_10910 [bacterium]
MKRISDTFPGWVRWNHSGAISRGRRKDIPDGTPHRIVFYRPGFPDPEMN